MFARRLKLTPRKKWPFFISTVGMGVPFLLLAPLCYGGGGREGQGGADGPLEGWLPWIFLVLYGLFFVLVGISRLSMNTLQGKLVRPNRRGRLFALSTVIGTPLAIAAVWWKLPAWLADPDGFTWVFLFCGIMFLVAALAALLLREPADRDFDDSSNGLVERMQTAWQVLRSDRDFRRLATVAMLFGTVLMLMPHYQAMGRERLGQRTPDLMVWVVVQHAGMALFSLLAGPLADRRGNRAAMHFTILGSAATPLFALGLSRLGPPLGGQIFWLVFVPVGLTSVTVRLMTHYVLEIAPTAEHPRYVSAFGLCFAMPVMLGGLPLGWLVDAIGFEPVFLGGAAAIVLGGLLSFRLAEPRHAAPAIAREADAETVV
jgi:predicted MFS family arabinose efflux permease